ncbi:hypothetical protein ANCCAN_11231 [Ancylostoma caninum]|uniref:Uncharacterized protein n=1 Tax=Ancylostoma caninum TaxID=29170 RepID=A0A368GGK7_ANCCA|nr:hypothetical protein ANCCAN_11231 [Ancylostoma caninum]
MLQMLSQLKFFLLPCLLMSSPTLEVLDYGMLSQNISSILLDPPLNSTDSDDEYKLFDNYFPLLLMLISLPRNETESLEKYMNQRTYAELKRMIDEKQKDSDITELITELEQNNTDLAEFISVVDNQKYVNLVEAYHALNHSNAFKFSLASKQFFYGYNALNSLHSNANNASIYNAIRGVWSSQLNPLLPAIDQLAILEYFAERRSNEHFRMSFWARIWAAIRAWLSGKQEFIGSSIFHSSEKLWIRKMRKTFSECNADEPRCMRRIVEKLPLEARVELDRAAETEDLATVENIITEELTNQPKSARVEYELWKNANQPPQPLLDIIADKTDVEERALERLRAFDLVNSLKDYYRAMIESRSQAEQEEIRRFFQRMNDTFARCFNPIKDRYEYRY